MLHRVIYASEAVGATGVSTLTLAHILGASEANNRRDGITAAVMFHRGHIVQAMEGRRADLDRLMLRLLADRRHTGLRVLVDTPISSRMLPDAISVCPDPRALLERIGVVEISRLTANEAEAMLDFKYAA
ncbi:BLUF domain-containing protein [Brevundimonas sp. M20]|uniref:BLUF domain-containing protein n=1 Tax=Brevundimonas sp. M20 TaxID=2591463 RepID=UPI00143D8EE0|nr:BLUF domain-containing protein [Brevundimonas sp. M20]